MSTKPAEQTHFETRLKQSAVETEALLMQLLSSQELEDEIARPENLTAAMRHGTLNGGKRLRPFLVVESAALFGGDHETALRIGAALDRITIGGEDVEKVFAELDSETEQVVKRDIEPKL